MDVSGIPNMGFGGSPAPFAPGGSFGTWSADQINSSMGMGPGGIGQKAQAYDPFGSGGGFGAQTDYYSNLGASYGRQTGGFGGYGGQNDPFSPAGGGGGGGGGSIYGGQDSGIANWGSAPMGGAYGLSPAEIAYYQTQGGFPQADPMNSGGYGGGGGGGAWDQSNQWGQPYAPPAAQTPFPQADPMNSGGYGGGGGGGGSLADRGAGGGGAWDTFNMWGQNYAPGGGGDMGVWGGGGGGGWGGGGGGWGGSGGAGGASSTSNMWGQPWAPKDQGRPAYSMWGANQGQPDYNGDMWGGRNALAQAMQPGGGGGGGASPYEGYAGMSPDAWTKLAGQIGVDEVQGLIQQGLPFPGAGGLGDPNVFNSAGKYQEQPGGWMTTGDIGMGIGGWGQSGGGAWK